MEQTIAPNIPEKKRFAFSILLTAIIIIIAITIIMISLVSFLSRPPDNFPAGEPITISTGMKVSDISHLMKTENVVKSELLFKIVLFLSNKSADIKASTYIFASPLNIYEVTERLVTGDFSLGLVRITHIEGEGVIHIAKKAKAVLENFDSEEFLNEAIPLEGKLFPDTYFVPPDFSAHDLVLVMSSEYEAVIDPLRSAIAASGLTETEVIILASIVEREANSPESMRLVAGILRKRLELGMALQVDASMEYVLDKKLSELTSEDLMVDSPYNTYSHNGLPPTPIGNPGLDSITAVINPTKSDFLYYITDKDGDFHYAKTFEQHKSNIARYLR